MTQTSYCTDHELGGETITEITLTGRNGARASILTLGGVVRDLQVPLKDGSLRSVVLGFADLADYQTNAPYLGAVVGRVCNRIDNGRFTLAGKSYQLPVNGDGEVHLHGGIKGFTRRNWTIEEVSESAVTLGLLSPDGEEGYPGNVTVRCRYEMTDEGGLKMSLEGSTDAPTLLNMTNHSYFTLAEGANAAQHWLEVDADFITPAHGNQIPTGSVAAVANSAYDFRVLRQIGADYEINFAVNGPRETVARIARLVSPQKDLEMQVLSDQPGLLFYTGAGLPQAQGLAGQKIGPNLGLCLEAAGFANAINNRYFPSPILKPGETYRNSCEYRFKPL